MYPSRELSDLARRKALLRQSIARRRNECASAVAEIARPLAWFDRAQDLWRRVAPLLGVFVASGGVGARTFFPRRKFLHRLARWTPVLFRVFTDFRRARAAAGR